MVAPTLLAGTLLTILEGATYVAVGLLVLERPVTGPARGTWQLFTAWWLAIGANKLIAAAAGLAVAAGVLGTSVYIAVVYLNLAILCVSLACLGAYLTILFTGRTTPVRYVVALYFAYLVLLTYNVTAARPVGVGLGEWRTFLVNEGQSPTPVRLLVLALLFVPQTVGAILYLGLYPRLPDRAQRYRVVLVGGAILAWTAGITLVALPGFSDNAWMQVGSRVVGATAAIVTLLAYRPPRWARERFGARSVGE